jgi:hypothetical protein
VGLARDTSIVEDAGLAASLIGVDGLQTLNGEEMTLSGLLLEAHRWAYDMLRGRHGAAAVAALNNEHALKRAVAYRFAEVLTAAGLLRADDDLRTYYANEATREVNQFVPEFADATTAGRVSGEAIPRLANVSEPVFTRGYSTTRIRRGLA